MRQRPAFLEVLNDLWHPEANPSGVINIGLAENVGQLYPRITMRC